MKDFAHWANRAGFAAVPLPPSPATSSAAAQSESSAFESPRRAEPRRRWAWKLVRIAGVDVYVHGTFLLLLAFVALGDLVAGHPAPVMVRGILLLLAVFATVVLHELGHALAARRFGLRTHDITLFPIGGVARLERLPEKPREQLLVALAGPAVNVAVALLLLGVVSLLHGPLGIGTVANTGAPFLAQLMWINVSLAVFNLLPGYPMDGGRILRAILAMRMAPERATRTAARIGQGVAVIFGFVGLLANPILVVIAVFVWLGAQAEHSASTLTEALQGLSVRGGMITDFKTVSPSDPLARVVELTLTGFQREFPVMEGTTLVGVITRSDVLRSLGEPGTTPSVRQAMRRQPETVSPSEALADALTRLRHGRDGVLIVLENEAVVGLLTMDDVGERVALGAAGRRATLRPRPRQRAHE